MKKLKGPELKPSELKVPPLLGDLYKDLRDRRLLPLLGLLLVAIVATPFLLGGGSDEVTSPVAPPAGGVVAQDASLTVAPAAPGLREPSKRLAGRAAKDPFVQKYAGQVLNEGSAPVGEGAGAEGGSGGEAVVEGSVGGGGSSSPAPESTPAEPSGSGGSSTTQPNDGELRIYTFAVDLLVSHTEVSESGKKKMSEPEKRTEVLPTTPLPGKRSPALTYLGVDPKTAKQALMLVSPEVESLLGDGTCVSGTSSCQLLALRPGSPEVVEYGPNGVRFKIEVLKIYPVISGHTSAKAR